MLEIQYKLNNHTLFDNSQSEKLRITSLDLINTIHINLPYEKLLVRIVAKGKYIYSFIIYNILLNLFVIFIQIFKRGFQKMTACV